jgi:hypothetical protein
MAEPISLLLLSIPVSHGPVFWCNIQEGFTILPRQLLGRHPRDKIRERTTAQLRQLAKKQSDNSFKQQLQACFLEEISATGHELGPPRENFRVLSSSILTLSGMDGYGWIAKLSQTPGSSDVSAQFNTSQIVTIKAQTFCPAVDQQLLSKTIKQWLKSFIFATG